MFVEQVFFRHFSFSKIIDACTNFESLGIRNQPSTHFITGYDFLLSNYVNLIKMAARKVPN